MHELAIAQSIITEASKILESQQAARITGISLDIGVLSGVEEHSLREAFPAACEGTRLEGAELVINMVEASVYCRDCGKEVKVEPPFMVCSSCMGSSVDFRAGREMIISQIKLER